MNTFCLHQGLEEGKDTHLLCGYDIEDLGLNKEALSVAVAGRAAVAMMIDPTYIYYSLQKIAALIAVAGIAGAAFAAVRCWLL